MSFENSGCCPPIKLCDTVEGVPIQFLRKFVKQCNVGQPVTVVAEDFELDGVTPYVVQGDVSFCMPGPDYELQVLCDLTSIEIGEYNQFIRKYTINYAGEVVTEDFLLDSVTPYTVSDEINVYECPESTVMEACYQVYDEVEPRRNVAIDWGVDGETAVESYAIGATTVTIKSENPQEGGGVLIRVPSDPSAPTQQKISIKFSRPVTDVDLTVSMTNNIGTWQDRFHSFNIFPTGATGQLDIGNGVSVEPTGSPANGQLQWHGRAIDEITFVYEVYFYASLVPSVDFEIIAFNETTGYADVRKAKCFYDSNHIRSFVDAITGQRLDSSSLSIVDCEPDDPVTITSVAYVLSCIQFDNSLPIVSSAIFSDDPVGTNTITFSDLAIASLMRGEIAKSLLLEQEQLRVEAPVTPFTINAVDGQQYVFNPSALQQGGGNSIFIIDESGIISWGADQDGVIENIEYSTLDGCECNPVEMIQEIHSNDDVFLKDVINPADYNLETGLKQTLFENGLRLGFGIRGPFSGPCPDEPQVIELNRLCCNDDLATNSPDVANKRVAWMDGSDLEALRNNGLQIAGNNGDIIDEVLDKLSPGVAPSWELPTTGHAANEPTFALNSANGLSGISFDAAGQNILDLEVTPRAAGTPFTFFKLYKTTELGQLLAVTSAGHNDGSSTGFGTWQLVRFGPNLDLSLRISIAAPTDVTLVTGNFSLASNNFFVATTAEAYDGNSHLITIQFDGTRMKVYFDGQLRLEIDYNTNPPVSELFRLGVNLFGTPLYSTFTELETLLTDELTDAEVSQINSYLICKWGIDPSLAVGGASDLSLAAPGTYSAPTPFSQILRADGSLVYKNSLNNQEFPIPPVSGMSICGGNSLCPDCFDWATDLCDRRDTVVELNLFQFDSDTEEVFRINGLTGAVIDTHTPTGVNWTDATIYDTDNDFLYLFDTNNNRWHRYDANNIAGGNTPITLTGDPMTGNFTFAAYDPATGFAYVGLQDINRFRIDFTALTALELTAINGLDTSDGYSSTSSLSIDDNGIHYATNYLTPSQGVRIHTINPLTGAATRIGEEPDIQLNGSDYDHAGDSGWYGIDSNLERIFRWTLPDMSDIQDIGTAFNPGGSLAVGRAEVNSNFIQFQRVFHKRNGLVATQDHDYEGEAYIPLGVVVTCPSDVSDEIAEGTLRQLSGRVVGPGGNLTIPAGTVSYSIAIETGIADIDALSRPTGYILNQPPVMRGDTPLLYPEVNIQNATGIVHLVYTLLE